MSKGNFPNQTLWISIIRPVNVIFITIKNKAFQYLRGQIGSLDHKKQKNTTKYCGLNCPIT